MISRPSGGRNRTRSIPAAVVIVSTDPLPVASYRSSRLAAGVDLEIAARLAPSGVHEIDCVSQIGFGVIFVGFEPSPPAT